MPRGTATKQGMAKKIKFIFIDIKDLLLDGKASAEQCFTM